MEKSDVYDLIPILGLIAWLVAFESAEPFLRAFAPGLVEPAKWIGFFIPFALMILIDFVYVWRTSPYLYVESFLSPRDEKFSFYVRRPIETREISSGFYCTVLNLAWPKEHPYYKKVSRVVVEHYGAWSDRVLFQPGKAIYKGEIIGHPNTTYLVLDEKAQGSFDIDHSEPIPVFRLRWAPGDYYIPKQALALAEVRSFSSPDGSGADILASGTGAGIGRTEVLSKIESQQHEITELRRQAYDWHQKYVRAEEVIDQLKNELMAVLRSKADFKASVIQYMLTIREAHLKIENALKALQPARLTFGKYLALTVIAVAALVFLSLNPELSERAMVWLGSTANQIFLIVIFVIVGGVFYYSRRAAR